MQASAKENEGIEELFNAIASKLYRAQLLDDENQPVRIIIAFRDFILHILFISLMIFEI
jgi:hypothetical protein